MSLIFMDGCENNDALQKYEEATNWGYAAGRNGQCIYLVDQVIGRLRKQVPAADEHDTFIFGKAFRNHNGANANEGWLGGRPTDALYGIICTFGSDDGATPHVTVNVVGGNTFEVRRGLTNGTLLGSYGWPTTPDYTSWYYVEVKAKLHDSLGYVTVKVNGQTILDLQNIDTKNGGTKTVFDYVAMSGSWVNNGRYAASDDIYLCNGAGTVNNDFLGDVAIETLYPNGDGSSSQFTGSDGNSLLNYQLVDEPGTVVMTDYVEDSVSGHKDLYAISNLARSSGPVLGVQVTDHVVNTDSGAVSAKVSLKSGATSVASAAFPLVTTPGIIRKMWEQNPDTSAAWDVASVNSLEAGIEVV